MFGLSLKIGESPLVLETLAIKDGPSSRVASAAEDALKKVAGHLSAHRRSSYTWAAKRVHSNAVETLEDVSKAELN